MTRKSSSSAKPATTLLEQASMSDIDRGLHVTKRQVAFFYDVKPQTVTNWLKSGLPITNYYTDAGERLFHLKYANEWVQENILKSDAASLARGRTSEDLQLKKLRGEKLKLEIAKKSGVVVQVEFAANIIRKRLLACKSRLLAIPKRLAMKLSKTTDSRKVQKLLNAAICEALEELRHVEPRELVDGTE